MKNIAKSAAKNMSSLASHTIVPTDVRLGRFTTAGAPVLNAVAAATRSI